MATYRKQLDWPVSLLDASPENHPDVQTMNDYWNDPPDEPETPECCGEIMEIDGNGNLICDYCGRFIQPQPDPAYDTLEENEMDLQPLPEESSGEYNYAADDLAFDAARERQWERRR